MPKPLKKQAKPKRPSDPNQWAAQLVRESTDVPEILQTTAPAFAAQLSEYMKKLGQKGGKIGGKRRLETMTFEQRSAVGVKAAQARWAKRKRAKKR